MPEEKCTADDLLNEIWQLMGNKKYLQGDKLPKRLSERTNLNTTEVRILLGQLNREGKIDGVSTQGDPYGKVRVLVDRPSKTYSETQMRLLHVMQEMNCNENEINKLIQLHEYFKEMSDEDIYACLNGVYCLKDAANQLIEEDHRVVSARHILGSSKAIETIGAAFGIDKDMFTGRPVYLVVAGPSAPAAVIFIENPASFECFCESSAVKKVVGVSTYGYSLSWEGIAKSWDAKKVKQLVRADNPPNIESAVNSLPCFFWGDLDKEGLNIYLQLRANIPHLQLSALYGVMSEKLLDPKSSHPYCNLAGKSGQRNFVLEGQDAIVAKLYDLCKSRAVDQEIIGKDDIERLCMLPMTAGLWKEQI
jgi:hypothetical protein